MRGVAWLPGAGAVLAVAATVVHAAVSPAPEAGVGQALVSGAPVLAFAVAGLVISTRAPGNRVGGLLLANACVLAGYVAAMHVRGQGQATAPLTAWAALWVHSAWPTVFAGLVALAFVFPDGRLAAPRWRPVAAAVALVYVGFLALAAFTPVPYDPPFAALPKPLPTLDVAGALLVGDYVVLATLLVAVAAVVARYRRSGGPTRAQLRWFALSAVLVPVTWVVCTVEFVLTGAIGPATFVAMSVTQIAVVGAVTIAVLRHRLYDIDVLINRTAVYAALTGLLAGVYGAIALLVGVAAGSGSRWTTAAATLAVALAFRPLRARVQRVVDRRFDRDRFDGVRRAERFVADVHAGRAEPEQVGHVLAEAVGDEHVELYFWLPDGPVLADARGVELRELPADGRERTPVRSGAQQLGVVLHAPSLRPALLRAVLETLGLAVEIARLRVEVRRQLARVRESRARIVAATHAERRRIERNLHDGAQQRLVSVGLTLRHVQHRLPPGDGAAALLDGAVAEVGAAIDELRELARGLGPAVLDHGLTTALADLAARVPLPVHLDTEVERLPDDVEAAAYFLASEAVTNVVKHARATAVSLSAGRADGSLRIVVADDGVGGAAPRPGSGLAGLVDRVDALGGRLEIDSRPGNGTRVSAELPCA